MSSVTSEEFLWSCELTAANKEYTWAPEVTNFPGILDSAQASMEAEVTKFSGTFGSPSETLTKPCSPQDPVKEEEDLEDDTKPVHK